MMDYEKTALSLMVENVESFENTNLKCEYFLNNNYSKMFKYLSE